MEPLSDYMARFKDYWPDYYHAIAEMMALAGSEGEELHAALAETNRQLDDQFVLTSSLAAVRRREAMLGIQADPDAESLSFRRKRIVNRYSTKPPFTLRYLQQRLDYLVGIGAAIASVDEHAYLLRVTASIDNAVVFNEVMRTIETIKPANLVYQQNTALALKIGVEEQIVAKAMTWNYRLDESWRLGDTPFVSYGSEVPLT
ncbi:putative phage tail protein [Paenibacillus sabuli]|nr:putative phage tail protein [Paenibacillus sabuli]